MGSIFSKIIAGEVPAHKIAETDRFIAFLDVRPMVEGHTLCVPKKEIDYVFDLTDDELSGLLVFSKRVAAAIKSVVPCARVAVGVLGLEVPHAHVHLVPVSQEQDFRFGKSVAVSDARMQELATLISERVELRGA
ncbi:HIT family protein [Neolewinella antarctica]|uniref:Histidine triad (HIT) family protein n=1 Tax=Neolewinella antarctica TaxID=442734 RepID=A0ABX0X8A5_9BACT|nr:HIT family protein [Neolewinella antarctica]NJC25083.1 histidine triad (HIT) family protein [Neolewinella antarctica]